MSGYGQQSPSQSPTATKTQRERKREIDRKSQRAVRARTKDYIAQLEQQNKLLAEVAQHRNGADLPLQVQRQAEENERLRTAVREIERVLKSCIGEDGVASMKHALEGSALDVSDNVAETTLTRSTTSPSAAPQSENGRSALPANNMLACGEGTRDYFTILNQAIMLLEATSRDLHITDVDVEEDILIRAVLHGWADAETRHGLDAGWQMLRMLDEGLTFRSGPVERAAILRMVRCMSLHASNAALPSRIAVPVYMAATSVQRSIAHARLVDYFAWPSIRDHLILTDVRAVPEFMTAQFALDAGFQWPYEPRDIAKRNTTTDMYTFSSDFDGAWHDLESWYFKTSLTGSLFPQHKTSFEDSNHWLCGADPVHLSEHDRAADTAFA